MTLCANKQSNYLRENGKRNIDEHKGSNYNIDEAAAMLLTRVFQSPSELLALTQQPPSDEEPQQVDLENAIDQSVCKQNSVEKIVYSVEEAACALGVSKPTIYDLLKSEHFPSFRIGKRIVIGKEALLRWVNEQCDTPLSAKEET